MPVGWFLAPGDRKDLRDRDTNALIMSGRICAMDRFTTQIRADHGLPPEWSQADTDAGTWLDFWAEAEVLGNYFLVKVNASAGLLTAIAQTADFQRIPARFLALDQTLGDLTSQERNVLLTRLQALGYTVAEISAALGSNLTGWRLRTFRDLLRFIASRRQKPRYDPGTDTIILDGPDQPTRPVEDVEGAVS